MLFQKIEKFSGFELAIIERVIESLLRKKGSVISLLNDLAVLHDQNDICRFDGREAVCHDKGGAALHHLREGFLDLTFHAGVDRRGRLIQNEHWRER